MKKFRIVMGTLALVIAGAIVVACTKEKVDVDKLQNIETPDNSFLDLNGIHVKVQHDTIFNLNRDGSGWLCFESKSDYELAVSTYSDATDSLMSSFEEALSFNSMRSSFTTDQKEEIEIEDDLLAMLLSPSSIVQVGNYVFHLDLVNDTILVYNQETPSVAPLVFSADDDVFDALEGNKNYDEKGCSAKNSVKNINFCNTKIDCKVVYQKAGIYFSLQSKIKKHEYGGIVELHLSCQEGTSSYVKNKDNTVYQIAECNLWGGNHSYHYRPYSGIKKLVQFHFTVAFAGFNALDLNQNTGWYVLPIHCGSVE